MNRAILAGWGRDRTGARARTSRVFQIAGRRADRGDGRGHGRADRLFCLPHPARHRAADDAAVHRPLVRRTPRPSSRTSSGKASPIEMKNDGAIVLVPKDRVPRLRMKLAEAGLPKGGGIGYEIFDKSDALGATSFVQNINHLRALEGELVAHHPRDRPGAGRARAPRAAGAAAVLARQGGSLGLDRAQGARRARAAAGARHPPPGRFRGQRAQARARLDRRRSRPPARRWRAGR